MLYKGVLFFINIDRVIKPELSDMYIEIKTRTWSKTDAENKANFVHEMMDILEIDVSKVERKDYLEMALQS
ncbi:MAG: hypothetical protein Q9P01_21925 [Anaerolineae bacterium]|nr:hypothetical protein [Anaerolineae bacterium]